MSHHFDRPVADVLLSDDLHQHAFAAAAIEFSIEDLLPRTKVQASVGDCDDHFATHQLPLDMRVAVIFAGFVMAIASAE